METWFSANITNIIFTDSALSWQTLEMNELGGGACFSTVTLKGEKESLIFNKESNTIYRHASIFQNV